MKIAVIGAGFVGGAVINALTCEYVIVDPKHGNSVESVDFSDIDAAFVCVPSPCDELGFVDASIIKDVVEKLPEDLLIVVKSTVTPDHLVEMSKGRRLVFNPEFLTQRSADEDFLKPDSLIFGGNFYDCRDVCDIYRHHTRVNTDVPCFYTDLATASMVKYALNCHFAAKVIFMNELYRLHREVCESSWEQFTKILGADKRLGPTHLQVPGPDGYFGFGGACFPKDTSAFLKFAELQGVNLTVLAQAVESNRLIRDD